MTNREKTKLIQWISDGRIQKAIDELLTIKRNKSLDEEAPAIAARYSTLKQEERSGTVTAEQLNVRKNKIVADLIHLINHPEDKAFSKDKPITPPAPRHTRWIYIAVAMAAVVILVILETSKVIDIIPSNDPMQLTVFVKDAQGSAPLELEGELNLSIGHRSFNKKIGEDGRTNFADIPRKYKGEFIQIGLKAEGWEIVGPNTFTFDDKAITIKVKRDNSLGTLRGRVTNQNGGEFIEGVKVTIKDTAIYTDSNGFFEIILPEKMRVKEATDSYELIVTKEGYKTKRQYHYPRSSDADIRLEKEKN